MIQFYSPDIEAMLRLPESDSQHCIRVLRMQPGDEIIVVDGKGFEYTCRLADNNHRGAAVEIISKVRKPPVWTCNITVAVAPTKHSDRMEWLVEKLVEIGINRFIPLKTARSERKAIKRERLEKIAVSAMKQSLKATLPTIDEMTPIERVNASLTGSQAQKFIAYCADEYPKTLLSQSYRPGSDIVIYIGPEGDFTPAEVEECIKTGFSPVTLGDNRLRTETAALVACDTVHIINQIK